MEEKAGDTEKLRQEFVLLKSHASLVEKMAIRYLVSSVPIPAACSWEKKPRQAGAVYEEYFRDRAQIYWRELEAGSYTLVFPLVPRFSGSFHLNPACVEPMYQLEQQSNNALRSVQVNPR